MITYLKDEDFEAVVKDKRVVLDFYADWCMPCNMLGEVLEEVVDENGNINVVKINVDLHQDLAKNYNVMSIPLLLLYDENKILKKHVGMMEKDELIEWVK